MLPVSDFDHILACILHSCLCSFYVVDMLLRLIEMSQFDFKKQSL